MQISQASPKHFAAPWNPLEANSASRKQIRIVLISINTACRLLRIYSWRFSRHTLHLSHLSSPNLIRRAKLLARMLPINMRMRDGTLMSVGAEFRWFSALSKSNRNMDKHILFSFGLVAKGHAFLITFSTDQNHHRLSGALLSLAISLYSTFQTNCKSLLLVLFNLYASYPFLLTSSHNLTISYRC